MSEVQFFQTKMGCQFYEVTMPELVRQLHRLSDMFALWVELQEKEILMHQDEKSDGHID